MPVHIGRETFIQQLNGHYVLADRQAQTTVVCGLLRVLLLDNEQQGQIKCSHATPDGVIQKSDAMFAFAHRYQQLDITEGPTTVFKLVDMSSTCESAHDVPQYSWL